MAAGVGAITNPFQMSGAEVRQLTPRRQGYIESRHGAQAELLTDNAQGAEKEYTGLISTVVQRYAQGTGSDRAEMQLYLRHLYYELGSIYEEEEKTKEARTQYKHAQRMGHPKAEDALQGLKQGLGHGAAPVAEDEGLARLRQWQQEQLEGMSELSAVAPSTTGSEWVRRAEREEQEVYRREVDLEKEQELAQMRAEQAQEREQMQVVLAQERAVAQQAQQQKDVAIAAEQQKAQAAALQAQQAQQNQQQQAAEMSRKMEAMQQQMIQLQQKQAAQAVVRSAAPKPAPPSVQPSAAPTIPSAGKQPAAPTGAAVLSQAAATRPAAAVNVAGVLQSLGATWEVRMSDGTRTMACVLTLEGVSRFGIDLNSVFSGCGGPREGFSEKENINKQGVLVHLDLYQQVALLRAIIRQRPELVDKVGLYNLRSGKKAREVLHRANAYNTHGTRGYMWFFTGEQYKGTRDESRYAPEGMVKVSELGSLKGHSLCGRGVGNGNWDNLKAEGHNVDGVVMLEGLL